MTLFQAQDVLICYGVTLLSSLLVVVSLVRGVRGQSHRPTGHVAELQSNRNHFLKVLKD